MITPESLAKSGTEHGYQAAIFCFFALPENKIKYPLAQRLFAVPNGFFSTAGQKAKEKAAGLKTGVPDMMLPVSKWVPNNYRSLGLFVELKVPDKKRANNPLAGCSEEQEDWILFLRTQGYKVEVAYGWEEAVKIVIDYLEG